MKRKSGIITKRFRKLQDAYITCTFPEFKHLKAKEKPMEKGMVHRGLEVLTKMDIARVAKILGEQETINLIGRLVSPASLDDEEYVDGIMDDRGLPADGDFSD